MGFTPSLRRARSQWATIAVAVIAALLASFLVSLPAPAHALSDTGTGGQFVPLQQRVFDSRSTTWGNAAAPVKKGVWTTIPVAGANGVPEDASAVQVTLTEVDASGNGVVYADSTNATTPNTSMPYLTWYDTNVSNTAILALGDDGGIQVSTNVTSMNLIVDVQGYYTSGDPTAGGYVPLTTATRVWSSGTTKYATNATVDVAVGGQAGVPANASSAMINIIESGSTSGADGYLVPYATGTTAPTYSSMNWTSGQNAEFAVPVKLGTNGKVTIKIKAGGSVALSVGIQGYFTATNGTAVLTPAHTRVYDSRSTAPVAQVAAGGTRKIQIAGVAGVPVMGSGITAAAVNIYVLSGSTSGHVNIAADDAAMGDDAQQFYTNRITYGFTTVKLGKDGGINLKNYASTPIDVLVDVEGWYSNPAAPTIACDGVTAGGWQTNYPVNGLTCHFTAQAPVQSDSELHVSDNGIEVWGTAVDDDAPSQGDFQLATMGGLNDVEVSITDPDGNVLSSNSMSFGLGDWGASSMTTYPESGAAVGVSSVTLSAESATDAFAADTTVQFTVSANPDGATNPVAQSSWGASNWNVPAAALSVGTTYFWTATVRGPSGPSGATAVLTSQVGSFTAAEDQASDQDLVVGGDTTSPDPSTQTKSLKVQASSQTYERSIYDNWLDKYSYRVYLRNGVLVNKIIGRHGTSARIVKAATQHFDTRTSPNSHTYVYDTEFYQYQNRTLKIKARSHFRVVVDRRADSVDGKPNGVITGYCVQANKVVLCPTWMN